MLYSVAKESLDFLAVELFEQFEQSSLSRVSSRRAGHVSWKVSTLGMSSFVLRHHVSSNHFRASFQLVNLCAM